MSVRFLIFFLSFMGLIGIFSCSYPNQWKTVPAGPAFFLKIPDWMKQAEDLKSDAWVQYANPFRNVYVVVFARQSPDSLEVYQRGATDILRKALDQPRTADFRRIQLAGLDGIREDIFGLMQKEPVYYSHITLDAGGQFIELCSWTRGEDRKLKYQPVMDSILLSFRR
jgi:hypothetical protein